MNITVTGSKREWTGPKENYLKHHEVIDHWCEGVDVECRCGYEWISVLDDVTFSAGYEYRIKKRKPKNNEVWVSKDGRAFVRNDNVDKMISLDGEVELGEMIKMKYSAPTPESYYARKFYQQSNDGHVAMSVLKEACRYED